MSNKAKRTGNGGTIVDEQGRLSPEPMNGEQNPGDGVDDTPRGLTGFFVNVIRGGKRIWSKTPKPVKAAIGIGVTAGGFYMAGKAGYSLAEKKYKSLIPTSDSDDSNEEYREAIEGEDNPFEGMEHFSYEGTDVYTDNPTVIETLNTPSGEATSE